MGIGAVGTARCDPAIARARRRLPYPRPQAGEGKEGAEAHAEVNGVDKFESRIHRVGFLRECRIFARAKGLQHQIHGEADVEPLLTGAVLSSLLLPGTPQLNKYRRSC